MAKKTNPHIIPNKSDWDEVFLLMAYAMASTSHCVSHRVGCLLVKDKRIISTGINGTPAGCPNCDTLFPQRGPNTGFDRAAHHNFSEANEIHAEMNAIIFAAREGTNINGATLYCTTQPCANCLKNILQSGIKRIVYSESYDLANYSEYILAAIKNKKIEFVHKPVGANSKCLDFINKQITQNQK